MELTVHDLGRDVPYDEGMAVMRAVMRAVDDQGPALLLLEHRPVITLTRSGGEHFLLRSREAIAALGVDVMDADRGGDVTFHGPGQLVGYPVVKLARGDDGHLDMVGYIHALERGLVDACRALGVDEVTTRSGKTGVWVGDEKLVAIGVGVGKGGVTRHGFALNVDIDLARYTDLVVPCGLEGLGVTSLARLLGARPPPARVRDVVGHHVARALGFSSAAAARGPVLGTPHGFANGAFHG